MTLNARDLIDGPILELAYETVIHAECKVVWPWIKQLGYHRGGWYIDTWWDRFEQKYFWPNIVPIEARGTYQESAKEILPEWQGLKEGDIIPDGPPGSAYYEVIEHIENEKLLLYSTSHFKYMAPQFVYGTKYAPKGAFCWEFTCRSIIPGKCILRSNWIATGSPKLYFKLISPLISLIDWFHQEEIFKGIKKRVETGK